MATITDEMMAVAEGVRGEWNHVAFRVLDSAPRVGDVLDASRVWVDGEPTDETLPGTCGLMLAGTARLGKIYSGNVVVVMGAERLADVYTEDAGEIILADPEVVAVWVDGVRMVG